MSLRQLLTTGSQRILVKKKEWVPLRTNPSGIGSSNAFAALDATLTEETVPVKDIA